MVSEKQSMSVYCTPSQQTENVSKLSLYNHLRRLQLPAC